jgi:ankyrin repeat protein
MLHPLPHNPQDKSGFTPLHFAACYGRESVVEWLVGQGSNVEAKNELEWTALHVASR